MLPARAKPAASPKCAIHHKEMPQAGWRAGQFSRVLKKEQSQWRRKMTSGW